jgi:sec-independent protein translocase protein TatB
MLDVGFSEILLTSAIALIVLGPERLPKVARQVGNWVGRARVMARQLSEQLEREVNAEELLKIHTRTSAAERADRVRWLLEKVGLSAEHANRHSAVNTPDPSIAPPTRDVPRRSAGDPARAAVWIVGRRHHVSGHARSGSENTRAAVGHGRVPAADRVSATS